jgi:predicted  nucleic acid-binding Zn-ribbon protein
MIPTIPTTQRRYQTVEQALKVINDAEKFGGSVKVNKSGDLERSNSSTNPLKNFFLFFRKKSDLKTQNREVIDTVVNKMKIEIIQASAYVRSVNTLMETQMNDLKNFKETGQLNQLKDQWTILKNTIAAAETGSENAKAKIKV